MVSKVDITKKIYKMTEGSQITMVLHPLEMIAVKTVVEKSEIKLVSVGPIKRNKIGRERKAGDIVALCSEFEKICIVGHDIGEILLENCVVSNKVLTLRVHGDFPVRLIFTVKNWGGVYIDKVKPKLHLLLTANDGFYQNLRSIRKKKVLSELALYYSYIASHPYFQNKNISVPQFLMEALDNIIAEIKPDIMQHLKDLIRTLDAQLSIRLPITIGIAVVLLAAVNASDDLFDSVYEECMKKENRTIFFLILLKSRFVQKMTEYFNSFPTEELEFLDQDQIGVILDFVSANALNCTDKHLRLLYRICSHLQLKRLMRHMEIPDDGEKSRKVEFNQSIIKDYEKEDSVDSDGSSGLILIEHEKKRVEEEMSKKKNEELQSKSPVIAATDQEQPIPEARPEPEEIVKIPSPQLNMELLSGEETNSSSPDASSVELTHEEKLDRELREKEASLYKRVESVRLENERLEKLERARRLADESKLLRERLDDKDRLLDQPATNEGMDDTFSREKYMNRADSEAMENVSGGSIRIPDASKWINEYEELHDTKKKNTKTNSSNSVIKDEEVVNDTSKDKLVRNNENEIPHSFTKGRKKKGLDEESTFRELFSMQSATNTLSLGSGLSSSALRKVNIALFLVIAVFVMLVYHND